MTNAAAAPYLFALFQIIPPRNIIPINAARVSVKRNACSTFFMLMAKNTASTAKSKS